jgi:hypothetical protein
LKRAILLGLAVALLATSLAGAAPKEMSLRVTEPGEAAEWTLGAVNTVKWSLRGELGKTVTIRLQRQGWVLARLTLAEAAPLGTDRSGSYKWNTPPELPPGGHYTVSVTAENGIGDMSGEFKLVVGKTPATQLSLLAPPKGEERWTVGSRAVIRWTFTGSPGQTVKLALIQKQAGDVIPIAASVPIGVDGKGTCEWTVPPLKPGNGYFVGIASNSNAFYQDMGVTPVTISAAK